MAGFGYKTVKESTRSWIGALGVLVFWIVLMSFYILRTPRGAFNHDFPGHLFYTQLIAQQHRLPAPHENVETYQPPLYYLMTSHMNPFSPHHIFWVRLFSMELGLATLSLILWFLGRCQIRTWQQVLALLFLMTTPEFVFLFTAYNNDALAVFFSVLLLIISYELVRKWRWGLALGLLGVCIAGLYTKLNVVFAMTAVSTIVIFQAWRKQLSAYLALRVLGLFLLAGISLFPWLVGHNYFYTRRLVPTQVDVPTDPDVRLSEPALHVLLTPPGWTRDEWKDPYAHLWEPSGNKKHSYLAYLFTTSILGEYTFEFLPSYWIWLMIAMHAWIYGCAFMQIGRSPTGRLAGVTLVLGGLLMSTLMLYRPYASLMDFRYAAWVWLPLAVLYAQSARRPWASPAFVAATGVHLVLISTLIVAAPRWNF